MWKMMGWATLAPGVMSSPFGNFLDCLLVDVAPHSKTIEEKKKCFATGGFGRGGSEGRGAFSRRHVLNVGAAPE